MLPAILLIDDDSTTNFLHRRLLTRLGITQEVLVAGHGQEALALLRARHQAGPPNVALILLDLNMPVMNGFEFLDAYQQLPAAQRARNCRGHAHHLPARHRPGARPAAAHCRLPQQAPDPRKPPGSAASPLRLATPGRLARFRQLSGVTG
ncbi:MAG: response regulator [Hymenobacter sp.]